MTAGILTLKKLLTDDPRFLQDLKEEILGEPISFKN